MIATAIFPTKANFRRKCTMAEGKRKNWRELCNAALGANDPDELLKILQELNKTLKREEQVRRDFREATRAHKSSGEIRFNTYRKSNDPSGYLKHDGADTNQ
jgi:hypothetical protein